MSKRLERYEREENRWKKIEGEHETEDQRQEFLRGTTRAQRNASSVEFNPITLKYNDTQGGHQLKYEDDQIRYRAAVRADRIYTKKHSQKYDMITGYH